MLSLPNPNTLAMTVQECLVLQIDNIVRIRLSSSTHLPTPTGRYPSILPITQKANISTNCVEELVMLHIHDELRLVESVASLWCDSAFNFHHSYPRCICDAVFLEAMLNSSPWLVHCSCYVECSMPSCISLAGAIILDSANLHIHSHHKLQTSVTRHLFGNVFVVGQVHPSPEASARRRSEPFS